MRPKTRTSNATRATCAAELTAALEGGGDYHDHEVWVCGDGSEAYHDGPMLSCMDGTMPTVQVGPPPPPPPPPRGPLLEAFYQCYARNHPELAELSMELAESVCPEEYVACTGDVDPTVEMFEDACPSLYHACMDDDVSNATVNYTSCYDEFVLLEGDDEYEPQHQGLLDLGMCMYHDHLATRCQTEYVACNASAVCSKAWKVHNTLTRRHIQQQTCKGRPVG